MASDSILSALEAAERGLSGAGVPHALVGGAALPAWGRSRATADVDLLIALSGEPEHGRRLLSTVIEAFRAAGFAHLESVDRARIEDKQVLHFWFPIRPQGFSIRVDLIAAPGPDYEEIVARAVPRQVDSFTVRVASCEDLILLKLQAGRPVDLADAVDLLHINKDSLDRAYLTSRAARKGIEKDLHAALEKAQA